MQGSRRLQDAGRLMAAPRVMHPVRAQQLTVTLSAAGDSKRRARVARQRARRVKRISGSDLASDVLRDDHLNRLLLLPCAASLWRAALHTAGVRRRIERAAVARRFVGPPAKARAAVTQAPRHPSRSLADIMSRKKRYAHATSSKVESFGSRRTLIIGSAS